MGPLLVSPLSLLALGASAAAVVGGIFGAADSPPPSATGVGSILFASVGAIGAVGAVIKMYLDHRAAERSAAFDRHLKEQEALDRRHRAEEEARDRRQAEQLAEAERRHAEDLAEKERRHDLLNKFNAAVLQIKANEVEIETSHRREAQLLKAIDYYRDYQTALLDWMREVARRIPGMPPPPPAPPPPNVMVEPMPPPEGPK
jgi:hypothetical protein